MTVHQVAPASGDQVATAADLATCPVQALRAGPVVTDGVALVLDGGTVRAFTDRCPHGGASLAQGEVRGGVVTCPRHGARYRLRDGRALSGPVRTPLPVFGVDVRAGIVHVVPQPPGRSAPLRRLVEAVRAVRAGR